MSAALARELAARLGRAPRPLRERAAWAYGPEAPCTLVVALIAGRGWVSRAIRWQTRGDWSHAALVVPWQRARLYLPDTDPRTGRPWRFADAELVLLESREPLGMVCDRTLAEAEAAADRVALRVLACTESARLEVLAWWGQRIAARQPYDWRGVLRFVSRRRRAKRDERWFCSEAVHVSLAEAGLPVLRCLADQVSPEVLSWTPALAPIEERLG